MVRISKLIVASGVILALGIPLLAQASPIGTPAANRIPTGNGKNLVGLFDNIVDPHGGHDAKGEDGKPRAARRHYTNKEWHEAYIAKHGHDLPSPLERPGGH